jgi:hypothetical protein
MTERDVPTAPAGPLFRRTWRAWRRAEDGGIAVFALFIFRAMLMQACASRPNHVVNANAAGLIDTFRSISRHIRHQSLRLTL